MKCPHCQIEAAKVGAFWSCPTHGQLPEPKPTTPMRILLFLSKHSTRDPGVCRDEIAIAIGVKGGNIQTILVESEQQVMPPVKIGHMNQRGRTGSEESRRTL